ncbi:MAG TPA: DUF3891 family protein [Candidatus Angelobacter sp.]
MIIRPLRPLASNNKFVSAWEAVLRTQTQDYESCWLITQPSHAALAADLAANISPSGLPLADSQILRAIALHDAGWGIPDAQAIMKSRSVHPVQPHSFVAMPVAQFLEAWGASIKTAESVSPAGGYIVSRHFFRLAEHRLNTAQKESMSDSRKLQSFLQAEERRQGKLAGKQVLSCEQLEQLTDLLQFCDLLSLFVCCGTSESVEFPEYFGVKLRVANKSESYEVDPPVIKSGAEFTVAALRYPATKEVSSTEIRIKIGN